MLGEIAAPIAAVDELTRRRVARMQQQLVAADGAGLAATQLGWLRRLFVFRLEHDMAVEALVNPRIVASSAELGVFYEGCLSFNSVTVAVERSVAVRVEGQDLDGRTRVMDVEGFAASLMQHEIDHLDGILTLHRAEAAERRRVTSALLAEARTRLAA